MTELNMTHFRVLQRKINSRLEELQTPHRDEQIKNFPWLYGALGEVPSKIMFICENPSLGGVKAANVKTIDGASPDIEAQWWGGAAKRFREALCSQGLKVSPPASRGGWRCYITNVVKEAAISKDQEGLDDSARSVQAREWAEILRWEYDRVNPQYVIAVGDRAHDAVVALQGEKHLPGFKVHKIMHYANRGPGVTRAFVIQEMSQGIRAVLGR